MADRRMAGLTAGWVWLVRWCLVLAAFLISTPALASQSVGMTVVPTTALQGVPTDVTYSASGFNSSNFAATVQITNVMPAFTTYLAGTTQVRVNGTLVSTANPTITGNTLRWPATGTFNLNAGATISITFQCRINAPVEGAFASDMTITDTGGGNDPASTGPTAIVSIGDPPALEITKTVSPTAVALNGTATYTIRVTNNGASSTNQVRIVETMPVGFSYINNSSTWNGAAIANPAIVGRTLTWEVPTTLGLTEVPGNSVRLLTFQLRAPNAHGTFDNYVHVDANNSLPADSGPSATLQVGNGASLSVCKGAGAVNSTPGCGAAYTTTSGADYFYMITLTNTDATAVTVTSIVDLRPDGSLTYSNNSQLSVNGGTFNTFQNPSIVGNVMTWSGSPAFPMTINPGENVRLRWRQVAPTGKSGVFSNHVIVSTTNTSTIETGPTAPLTINGPNLNVTKTVISPTPATLGAAGGRVRYEITITNTSGVNANIDVLDIFPQGWTAVTTGGANDVPRRSINGGAWANLTGGTVSGNTFRWNNITVNANQNYRIQFSVNCPANFTPGQYPNVVQIFNRTFPNNDIVTTGDTAPVTVIGSPQVSIDKSVTPDQVLAFQTVTYTIRVRNAATATANAVIGGVTDTLPVGFNYQPGNTQISSNGTTFTPFQNPTGTFGTISWSGAPGFPITLAPGQERYIRFLVQVSNAPGSYDNLATVLGNNFTDVSYGPGATVIVGVAPNVSVCKGAAQPANTVSSCGATTSFPGTGGTVCYTITVTNTGDMSATGVTIQDTLPPGFTYVSGSSFVSLNGGPFTATTNPSGTTGLITWPNTWTVSPTGGTLRLRFNATTTNQPGSYTNVATAYGTNFSARTSGPTATVTVGNPPVISLPPAPTATVNPSTIPVGSTATYTFQINNAAGSLAAQGVTMQAILPQYMSIVPGTTQQSVNGAAFTAFSDPSPLTGTVTWTGLSNILANQNVRLRFTVAVDPAGTAGTYLVEARAAGSNFAQASIGDPSSGDPQSGAYTIPPLTVTAASAVTLANFEALAQPDKVKLSWRSGSEWQNLGYNLYRADSPTGPRQQVNAGLITGQGTGSGRTYNFTDSGVEAERTYYYWIEDVEFGGALVQRGPLVVTTPDNGVETYAFNPVAPPPGDGGSAGGPSPGPTTPPAANPDVMRYVSIVSQDDRSIVLEMNTPDLVVQERPGETIVALPGLPVITEPGFPQLPQAVVPLGAPRDVPYHLEVLEASDPLVLQDLALSVVMPPSGNNGRPQPGVSPTPTPPAAPPAAGHAGNPANSAPQAPALPAAAVQALGKRLNGSHLQFAFGILSNGGLFPAQLAEVAAQADLRDTRILQLKLYPAQYEADKQRLTQYRKLKVKLSFDGATVLAPTQGQTAWDKAMAKLGEEYGLLQRWISAPQAVTDDFVRPTGPSWRLTVDRPGIQRLSASDLTAAGVPLDQPERLQLFHRDREVPLDVRTEAGQVTAVACYCPSVETAHHDKAYYLLTLGESAGQRMAVVDATPGSGAPERHVVKAERRLEENAFYWANKPDDEFADHWYWQVLTPTQQGSASFQVGDVAEDQGLTAKLTVGLRGAVADPKVSHANHVRIALNGSVIADLRWPGLDYLQTTVGFANHLLQTGNNTLTMTLVNDTGAANPVVYVDAFNLVWWQQGVAAEGRVSGTFESIEPADWVLTGFAEEPAVYDVTDPQAPRLLSGGTLENGTLRFHDGDTVFASRFEVVEPSAANQPAIASFAFADDLHGATAGADWVIITPAALRPAADRLAMHRGAQGLSTRVVDVADVYAEFSGGHPEPEAIRRFLAWAVANWPDPKPSYVVLLGDGHYDPRNHYGTSSEVMIPPLLRDNPSIGTVANENGFAAVIGDDQLPDLFVGRLPANDLAQADAIVDKLIAYDLQPDGPWMGKALHVWDDDDPAFGTFAAAMAEQYGSHLTWQGAQVTNGANVRAKLQQGNGLVLYVGHGYIEGWASEEAFSIWRAPNGTNDIDAWAANDQTGVYVTANCLNGYFHDPDYPCLGEELLRASRKGAVAFWGTGGYTIPAAQFAITRRFFHYALEQGLDLGSASTLAKIGLFLDDSPYWREEIAAWVLLGDPATKLRRLP